MSRRQKAVSRRQKSAKVVDAKRDAAFFRRLIADCDRAFKAGAETFLLDALQLCGHRKLPLPRWMVEGIEQRLMAAWRVPRPGKRRAPSVLARHRQDRIHFARWTRAWELRKHRDELRDMIGGTSWEKIFAAVSRELKGTPAQGSWLAMRKSFYQVQREIRAGRGAQYGFIHRISR